MGIEADFNEHGAAGRGFCAVADGYAKRPGARVEGGYPAGAPAPPE